MDAKTNCLLLKYIFLDIGFYFFPVVRFVFGGVFFICLFWICLKVNCLCLATNFLCFTGFLCIGPFTILKVRRTNDIINCNHNNCLAIFVVVVLTQSFWLACI